MKNYFFLFLAILLFSATSAQSVDQAMELFEGEKIEEAQVAFEKVLEKNPQNKVAIEYLGDVYFRQEKWGKAVAQFKQLVAFDTSNPVYHFKYAGAIGLLAKNNKLKALFLIDDIKFHFKKAAALDVKYVDARLALVQLYTELPMALGGSKIMAQKYAEQIKPLSASAYQQALGFLKG